MNTRFVRIPTTTALPASRAFVAVVFCSVFFGGAMALAGCGGEPTASSPPSAEPRPSAEPTPSGTPNAAAPSKPVVNPAKETAKPAKETARPATETAGPAAPSNALTPAVERRARADAERRDRTAATLVGVLAASPAGALAPEPPGAFPAQVEPAAQVEPGAEPGPEGAVEPAAETETTAGDPAVAPRPAEPAVASAQLPVDAATQAALQKAAGRVSFPKIVAAVYAAGGWRPRFFDGRTPGPQAAALVALVADLPSHALESAPYGLTPATAQPAGSAAEAATRDARLTAAVVRYVMDFQFILRAHPQDLTRDVKKLAEASHEAIVARTLAMFPDVEAGLKGLWPKRPEYAALRKALPEWRERAKHWRKQPKVRQRYKTIEPGEKDSSVLEVQKRLAFDGTFTGELTSVLDEPTIEALKRFQARNHLTPDGKLGKDTFKILRIRPHERLGQIEASLAHWRESLPRRMGLTDYIRVNLPGYHLELFEKGERKRQHRVIVGNNNLEYNRQKWRQGFLNRTPLLETRMLKVVLNPVWIVPSRIKDTELGPKQAKDGSYFKRHGIRRSSVGGKEVLVQSSGSHNALGQVKFLLERTNAIYLHDTNKRHLFDRDERALSHGCMRVDGALDLAEYILTTHGGMTAEAVRETLESRSMKTIDLENPIPVYVEYISTGLGDDGELVFYEDIYDYDDRFRRGKLPTYNDVRYGAGTRRPREVPRIPYKDYKRLKAEGGLAPAEWPPAGADEPAAPGDG